MSIQSSFSEVSGLDVSVSLFERVSNVQMAANTGHHFAVWCTVVDLVHHAFVAFSACDFRLLSIPFGNSNGFVKVASRECIGVQQAVDGFAPEFGKYGGGVGVAIVALCMSTM